jgi:hypothetical protein
VLGCTKRAIWRTWNGYLDGQLFWLADLFLLVSGTKHSLGDSFNGIGLRSWNFNQHCTPPPNRVVTRGS